MSAIQKSNQPSDAQTNSYVTISCAFHKDKVITNFCCNQSCLLPMCPTCVAIHSEEHREQNTHGQFESIQQVIQSISMLLLKVNKSLQDLSEEYTEDYWNKEKILQSCKESLNNQKKRLIRQIQRKFEQIQQKMTRKINQFQDEIHDRYRQLESEIQYLYESVNKQRQDFASGNERILKNLICFYSQRKEEKMKEWQNKFRTDVNQLKRQSIRIKCNDEVLDFTKSLDYFFNIENFIDEDNEYLLSSARQLVSSSTKRKTVESPRWTEDKENSFTIRNNTNKYLVDPEKSVAQQLNSQGYNIDSQNQWSASKF